ncbi:hypothetical protein OOU_Y34scaffold00209g3 [Pyricularia oryzae Y34]|uniref:Uncharacterized protein n=1 Tax=Pyricularia oryzae (strain Y34) TaxID=1143189 RepID=A0AA97P676_PYRO3|nr:hypothetical protein OOU_Y34scaffold00209g3 [Pyricularia oryzae Y34]
MSDIEFKYPVLPGRNQGPCFMWLYRPDRSAVAMADLRNYGETTVTVQGVDITFTVTEDCRAIDKKGNFPEGLFLTVGTKPGSGNSISKPVRSQAQLDTDRQQCPLQLDGEKGQWRTGARGRMKIKSSIRSRLPEIPKPQKQGHKDFYETHANEDFFFEGVPGFFKRQTCSAFKCAESARTSPSNLGAL